MSQIKGSVNYLFGLMAIQAFFFYKSFNLLDKVHYFTDFVRDEFIYFILGGGFASLRNKHLLLK